jgi:hypothetical protein
VDVDPDGLITRFPEQSQLEYIDLCRSLVDAVVVTDPELETYVPGAHTIQRAIDLDAWQYVGIEASQSRPLVIHAPSRKGVKGTSHVISAVRDLRKEGLDFDFQLIQGTPQDQVKAIYRRADIVIDQLRIGWYGVLAVEGMALGKAVISYIRDDLIESIDGPPPVQIANPDTIKEKLRHLIQDPRHRSDLAQRGHDYCRRTHDAAKIARDCITLYDDIIRNPKPIDLSAYMKINEEQEQRLDAALSAAKARRAAKSLIATLAPQISSSTVRLILRKAMWHYRERGFKSLLHVVAKRLLR